MVAIFERRTAASAGWSRRIASFSAVLFILAGVGHRYHLIDTFPFLWLLGLAAVLALSALLLAAVAFTRVWGAGDQGAGDLIRGALVAALVLAPFLLSGYRIIAHPFLTDISTDLDNPPALIMAMQHRDSHMNAVEAATPEQRSLQRRHYPLLTGRRFALPAEDVLAAVLTLAEDRGWRILGHRGDLASSGETTVEAVAFSFVFRFPVDVAVRVLDEGEATYVDMRSASRYGRHDLGDNAARIEGFLQELEERLTAAETVVPDTSPALPEAAPAVPDTPPAE